MSVKDLGHAAAVTREERHGEFETKYMRINVGPQHPSTHGVLRLVVDLDGEQIVALKPQIGYLHTGFEKTMENRTYQQGVTYYQPHGLRARASPTTSPTCCRSEKLLDAKVPERAQRLRVALVELNRIASHLLFVGTGPARHGRADAVLLHHA